jgi:hypothetical protein
MTSWKRLVAYELVGIYACVPESMRVADQKAYR